MKLRSRAFALAVVALAFAACDSQSGPSSSQGEEERVGNLKAALTLPDDTEITEVDFEITHPSGFVGPGENGLPPNEASPRTGSIPVGNSTILTFRIGNLLVQNGYSLHLHAETSFGNTCDSTNTFDIGDNGVTILNVVLECTAQDNAGDLIVNGNFQSCPLVTALQAIPAEVTLGNDIALEAWISHGDSDVAWTGAGGDFSDDVGYTTTFTCQTPGSHQLTATISNIPGSPLADCDDARTLDVICTLGAGCGNMQSDPGEGCDDGNTLGGDDCSPTCQLNVCGDGDRDLLGPATEECDDSNTITESCVYGEASCTVCDSTCHSVAGATHRCGDSITDTAAGETCDDGNTVTEECAYGLASCPVCDSACHSVAGDTDRCGDGTIDSPTETCDDGNTVSGDGCTATCTIEVDNCTPCRSSMCSNWVGINPFAGCMSMAAAGHTQRTGNGADMTAPDEMTFVQQCIDTVNCGTTTNCAYRAQAVTDGVFASCYCGTQNATACQTGGPATDANTVSCRARWETATREPLNSTAYANVFGKSGDYTYPAGWAYDLLSCSQARCSSACDNVP